MSNKMKAVIAIGGTGGHVFPGYNLAKHLLGKNLNVELVSDQRGYKYLKQFKDQKVFLLPSSPLIKKNLFKIFSFSLFIFYSIIRSLFFLIRKKPTIIFGMGGMHLSLYV